MVRRLVADGTTVLLTTQYLEEADQLADQITVIDHGRVVADGKPGRAEARRSAARRCRCGPTDWPGPGRRGAGSWPN